jgi:hypothetical protein
MNRIEIERALNTDRMWLLDVLKSIHEANDKQLHDNRHLNFPGVVALGEQVRAATLMLRSDLTDAQLQEMLPGAPWADGTVGGVMANHGGHGRRHWAMVQAALETK